METQLVDDKIDSKIKFELDCLNSTSKKINDLENLINEKRSQYKSALTSSTQNLDTLAQKLGDCVSKARPYYEAKRVAKNAHNEAQEAALKFERAVSMHTAAREMVTVAEHGMMNDPEDPAWAEMLNHATSKVNDAESERYQSEINHQLRAEAFKLAEETVKKLQKSLKSSIKKSQQYFEMKKLAQQTLETVTESVNEIEAELKQLKELYSKTLQNLEKISISIHASRESFNLNKKENSSFLGQRQEGVGAETPFNEQEIVKELKQEICDSASQLTVLNDLKDSDSVDFLNNFSGSGSLNAPSCSLTSNISHTSNENIGTTFDVSTSIKDLKVENNVKEKTTTNISTSCKETSNSAEKVKFHLSGHVQKGSLKLANKPNGDGELVLSIAGLGEVSELNP